MKLILKNCWTTFSRFKTATFLNVAGLSAAFAVFIVIATQLRYEFTYDTSYKNIDHLYRFELYDSLSQNYGFSTCLPLFEAIAENIPGIEVFGAYQADGKRLFTRIDEHGNRRIYYEQRGAVTSGFLDVFSLEIVAGDAKAALEGPQQCIIPQSMAQRIFGNENPIGQTLLMEAYEREFLVGAVYKDFPKNSSLINALFSKLENRSWEQWSYTGFFRLTPGVDVSEVNRKINESDAASLGISGEEALEVMEWATKYSFSMNRVKEIYFSKTVRQGYGGSKVGNKTMSYILMLIGVLIVVVAYVNFTNFSTAMAPVRIKSINTRRVMGGTRGELRSAVMTEAAITSFLSFILSLLWVWLFSQSSLSTAFFVDSSLESNIDILVITGVMSILIGFLAGAYPAVYMTSFQPALILKGSFALTPQGIRLRNILITIQFFTATTLIVGALFIKLQHSYMRNQPIGMERENIVVIEVMNEKEITTHIDAVANQMMENVHVRDYTTSMSKPGFVGMGWGRVFDGKQVQMRVLPVRYNFLRFFNIPVIEGDDFFEHNQRGGSRVIFNKKTVDNFGLDDPIGKELSDDSGLVVGVAANANFASLRQEIEPLAFVCSDNWPTFYLYLKIDAQDTPSTVAHIKNVFSRFSPNEINLSFFDDDINNLYVNEANLANIISL
ncbi:MAG: ABC transporter permease, partial [Bacteroidales bacterium]|nr:ABC transporter permease [Bacteroidales bacterium]